MISQIAQLGIVVCFAIIGAGLKYIDDSLDEERYSKRKAAVIAMVVAILWVWLSLFDSISATILLAILLGVLITGKIDNWLLKVSAVCVLLITLLAQILNLLWAPLVFLVLMGIVDEKGNDYVDNYNANKSVCFFFTYRFCMKIGMLSLCLLSVLPWLDLLAFLAFDSAYALIGAWGKR